MHSSDSRRSPTKLFSQRVQLVLCLALVCFLSVLVLESHGAASDYMDDDGVNTPSSYSGQYEDLNYYDDYDVYSAGYHYDDKSDDGGEDYFNQYTGGYDDVDGDYFFEDYETTTEDCTVGPDGEVTSEACPLKVEGADAKAPEIPGGLDGVYKAIDCRNGRPLYQRQNSPPNEDRVLWYSQQFRDWDVGNGTFPQEEDILMYGGSGGKETRPHLIVEWHVAADFKPDSKQGEDYVPAELKITCDDGKEEKGPATTFGKVPFLTDEDMEQQYSQVYRSAAQRKTKAANDGSDINLGMVSFFVVVGIALVFGLPYMVSKNKKKRGEKGTPAPSLLAILFGGPGKRGHSH